MHAYNLYNYVQVAAVSGDVGRALYICQRSTELHVALEKSFTKCVGIWLYVMTLAIVRHNVCNVFPFGFLRLQLRREKQLPKSFCSSVVAPHTYNNYRR